MIVHKNCNDMMPPNPANGEPEKEAAWKYYFHSLTGLPTTPEYNVIANKLLAETKRIFDPYGYISTAAKEQADLIAGKLDQISSKMDAILRNGETQTAQSNGKRHRRERAPGVMDKWIAQQFNNYALPLIAKCYPINKGEDYIRRNIIPTLTKQGRNFAMNNKYGGLCVYEPMRGGNKSGYATVGTITERQIKTWITKYPDKSNPEPKSGFHAGMLKDKASIEEAAKKWGDYWRRYALAFFEWRKTHTGTPRKQFRYSPSPVIHGAEHTAASAPQS